MAKVHFIDGAGAKHEVDIEASIYREAADNKISVPQLLARKYGTDAEAYGSVFSQMAASAGIFLSEDRENGFGKARIGDVLDGALEPGASVSTRESTPASRILFPAAMLGIIENAIYSDKSADVAIFNDMVAVDETINGPRYEQPIINFQVPEAGRSSPIAQLSEPNVMGTLTTSDKAGRIPTFSIGLAVSKEAQQASTIDFVALSLARQAEEQRAALVDSYISSFLNGDADQGTAALAQVKANTFDPTIAAAGVITHKAAVKWLRSKRRKGGIDYLIGDVDAYLAWVNRTGRPTVQDASDASIERLQTRVQPLNADIPDPKFYIVEAGVIPANTLIGFSSRYAIRRIRNSGADYQAAEALALRKGDALRFDFGEVAHRLFDDAWSVLTLTV